MKLLLDENLSPRLVGMFADLFPGSVHVHDAGLGGDDDGAVWRYAKTHGFAIVSKDSDFMERSVLEGVPAQGDLGAAWELLDFGCRKAASVGY